MSDHEFEKQVQRKLDELKLRPSNAVWTAIEEDIRQHKPRRRFAFWWPLAVVCLAVTGYVIYTGVQSSQTQPLAQSKSVKINPSSSNSTHNHSEQNSTQSKDNIAIKNSEPVTVSGDEAQSANGSPDAGNNAPAGTRNSVTGNQTGIETANNDRAVGSNAPTGKQQRATGNRNGQQQADSGPMVGNKERTSISDDQIVANNDNTSATNREKAVTNHQKAAGNRQLSSIHPNNKKSNAGNTAPNNPTTAFNPSSNDITAHSANVTHRNTPKPGSKAPAHLPAPTQQQQPGTLASTPAAGAHETTREENRLPDAVRANTEKELAFATPQLALNNTAPIATDKAGKPFQLAPNESARAPIQKQPAPKWQFGVMGNAGISRLTQSNLFHINGWLGTGPLSQEKSQAEDLAQRNLDRLPNSPGTSYNNSPLLNTVPPPQRKTTPITQGFSWSAGVFAQRPLSKRLRLSIGLQYAYMSVHTTVGKLVERAVTVNQAANSAPLVNRYYTSYDALQMGNGLATSTQFNLATVPRDSLAGQDYTYKFHSIELPITINWQINKGRQLPPFVLDAGFSIAQLLSADALHYDGTQDIYYKDNRLFSKTQVNALMGLNVGLFQRSKLPIWVGPHLRYALTGLLKKEVSNGQYLWSTGIQVKLLLNRL